MNCTGPQPASSQGLNCLQELFGGKAGMPVLPGFNLGSVLGSKHPSPSLEWSIPCFLSPHLLLLPMLRLQSFSQGCFFLQWSMLDTRFFINAVMHLCSKSASSDLLEEWSRERGMMVGIEFTMTSDWITLCMPALRVERIGG